MNFRMIFERLWKILAKGENPDEMRYVQADMAFLTELEALQLDEVIEDTVYGLWLQATDHREKHVLSDDGKRLLWVTIQAIIARHENAAIRQN